MHGNEKWGTHGRGGKGLAKVEVTDSGAPPNRAGRWECNMGRWDNGSARGRARVYGEFTCTALEASRVCCFGECTNVVEDYRKAENRVWSRLSLDSCTVHVLPEVRRELLYGIEIF